MDKLKDKLKELYEAPDFFDIRPVSVALGGEDSEDDDIHDPDIGDGDF